MSPVFPSFFVKSRLPIGAGVLCAFALAWGMPQEAKAQAVSFDIGRAEALGNACEEGANVQIVSPAANNLSLRFYGTLLRVGQSQLADVASCRAAVPMSVPRGFYISRLRLEAYPYLSKSSSGVASVTLRASFFGSQDFEAQASVPSGRSSNGTLPVVRSFDISRSSAAARELCSGFAASQGLLRVGLTGSATVPSFGNWAIISFGSRPYVSYRVELRSCGF